MKAINGNIFIERHEEKSELFGMKVSGRSAVKNYIGVIKACESYKFVGKEVHVPHYMVDDMEIRGEEYAVTKIDNIFAIRDCGDDKWTPVNRFVKIRKCVNDHVRDSNGEIALYMTDNHIEHTNFVQVIDVSDDCKAINKSHVGMFCIAPEDSEKLARLEYSKEFMLHEDEIKFVTKGD